MSISRFLSLQSRLDDLDTQYSLRFAEKSRVTRDIGAIDALAEQVEFILHEAETAAQDGLPLEADVIERAQNNLQFYREERTRIIEAKESLGPRGIEAQELTSRAVNSFHYYRRNFAGQSRASRDLLLLAEMTRDLETIEAAMSALDMQAQVEGLEEDIESVREYLELFQQEREAIATARGAGDLEEQATNLGSIANGYFDGYRIHFAGFPRMTRRPELLERIVAGLQQTLEAMESLRTVGLYAEFHLNNIQLVEEQLQVYKTEFENVRDARIGVTPGQLADHLGQAANQIADEYTRSFGDENESSDLVLLSNLCDRLSEVGRQMHQIHQETGLAPNERNLRLVLDTLDVYQRTYDRLLEEGFDDDGSDSAEIY